MDKKNESLFVEQWAPTLLILGLYNKLVKVADSDRVHSLDTAAFRGERLCGSGDTLIVRNNGR